MWIYGFESVHCVCVCISASVYVCISVCVFACTCACASVQCTMVVCEETTPGKLPLDHAVAGAKVPLNTLYYGRLQLHHVFVGVQVPLSTLYYTTDG